MRHESEIRVKKAGSFELHFKPHFNLPTGSKKGLRVPEQGSLNEDMSNCVIDAPWAGVRAGRNHWTAPRQLGFVHIPFGGQALWEAVGPDAP